MTGRDLDETAGNRRRCPCSPCSGGSRPGRRGSRQAAPTHVPSFTKLPDSAIAQFKANPQGLLTTYASAGLPLSTEVRSLVLTDPSLVEALITVAKGANDAQKAAIGAGLAEAARILAATDPQLAAQIQGRRRAIRIGAVDHGLHRRVQCDGDRRGGRRERRRRRRRRRRPDRRRRRFHRIEQRRERGGAVRLASTNGASAFGSIGGAGGGGFSVVDEPIE